MKFEELYRSVLTSVFMYIRGLPPYNFTAECGAKVNKVP
jgi:hypothetical protein